MSQQIFFLNEIFTTSVQASILLAFAVLTFTTSCKKETESVKPEPTIQFWTGDSVKIESDYMAFKNKYVWENTMTYLGNQTDSFLELWENFYGFASLRKSRENDTLNCEVADYFLQTALNLDRMVRIGDSIFRLDLSNQRVYVLKNITETNITLLRGLNLVPGTIDTFPSTYELLWPEDGGPEGVPINRVMACRESGKDLHKVAYPVQDYSHSGINYAVRFEIVHQPASIWHSFNIQLKHRKRGGGKKQRKNLS